MERIFWSYAIINGEEGRSLAKFKNLGMQELRRMAISGIAARDTEANPRI
jgi:hypothetical protein